MDPKKDLGDAHPFEALFLTLGFLDPAGSPGFPGNVVVFAKNGAVSQHGEAMLEKLGAVHGLLLLGSLQLLRVEKTIAGEAPVYFAPGSLEHSLDKPQDSRVTEAGILIEVAKRADEILAAEGWSVEGLPGIAMWDDTMRADLGLKLGASIQAVAREWERAAISAETKAEPVREIAAPGRGAPRI